MKDWKEKGTTGNIGVTHGSGFRVGMKEWKRKWKENVYSNGLCRDYYKDPFLHSSKGRMKN